MTRYYVYRRTRQGRDRGSKTPSDTHAMRVTQGIFSLVQPPQDPWLTGQISPLTMLAGLTFSDHSMVGLCQASSVLVKVF